MTESETIDYLTDRTAGMLNETELHLVSITTAMAYGFDLTHNEHDAYATSMLVNAGMQADDLPDYYAGDLDNDISDIAANAIRFLNDHGIVPTAYDHGETDPTVGFGNSTARDGAARLDGAGKWVTV